jgi:hypothetical protein
MLVVCRGNQKRIVGQLRPSLYLEIQCKEGASKSRDVDGDEVSLQALFLPGRHRDSIVRTVPRSLRVLPSTLLGDMKQHATDRFIRDTIGGCYCAERFLLLNYTLHYRWPKVSGCTVCRVLWPRPPMLRNRRMTSLRCCIRSLAGAAPFDTGPHKGLGRGRKLVTEHSTPVGPG